MDLQELRFTRDHEWVKSTAKETALVGVTDYAQDELGDIVYVDLPNPGTTLIQFHKFGEIESVKSVSDLLSPISGEVLEANPSLNDHPELVNEDPYGEGWLLHIRITNVKEMENLMAKDEYDSMLSESQDR